MIALAELFYKILGRTLVCSMAASAMFLAPNASAQPVDSAGQPAQATCTFDDGSQMYVRYHPDSEKNLPSGRVWAPGGQPMLLFTDTTLELGNSEIPVGAYSMYVIPEKREWTLIVNRDVKPGSGYQKDQDLVREPMEIGELEQAQQQTSIYFGHSAAKQCNMRIYHGSVGTWVEFKEK
jgi:Protein of unknown function (DUF2911)